MNDVALDLALRFTLPAEGGFVDNPLDHGGATNRGITQAVYDAYRVASGELPQSVALVGPLEVRDIYESEYWAPARCDLLAPALAVCHFDWSVNHGVTGAMQTLQKVLDVDPDGICGAITRAAMESSASQPQIPFVDDYLQVRGDWYLARVKAEPDQAEFLDGWLARDQRLRAYIAGIAA